MFDSIKNYTQITQPKTGIIGAITFASFIETKSKLDAVVASQKKPACVIFYADADGNVTDKPHKNAYATFDRALAALGGNIMPAFYIANTDEANTVATYINSNVIKDVFVISQDPELVKYVRKTAEISRGIIDFTETYKGKTSITDKELLSIKETASANFASIVIIPSSIATRDSVKYITDRLVTVWINETEPISSVTQAYRLLTAGPHGIIFDNTAVLLDVADKYMPENALIRTPLNIGHRGMPSHAPENTVEGSVLAYENGADVIENDIYLTTDGEIVVMHDSITERTCNGNLTMEASTLAELKELYVNKGHEDSERFKNCKIPTLREYYERFKGKDVKFFVEIKTQNTQIVEKYKRLTEEYDIADQLCSITFHAPQIEEMKKTFPQISVGYLMASAVDGTLDGAESAGKVLELVQKHGSTYNPYHGGHTKEYVENANMRGLTTWPWTINDEATYIKFFLYGINGITTNHAYFAKDYAKFVDCPRYDYVLKSGEKHTVSATVTTYGRVTSELDFTDTDNAEIIILDGGENIDIHGGNMSFKSDNCTVSYAVQYKYHINDENTYTIYSQPVTVTVKP